MFGLAAASAARHTDGMTWRWTFATLALLAAGGARGGAIGCADAASAGTVAYAGFARAWRLTNDTVELVVAPDVGRIVRYGRIGGPNMLWSGVSPTGGVWLVGTWRNWGGDKIWAWPQDGWPRRTGSAWPPPGDGATQGWQVASASAGRLCLTGPIIEGHGCRAVREIALAATGTVVTLRTSFEALDGASLAGLAVWDVAQVPAAPEVDARLAPDATGTGVHDPAPGWDAPQRDGRHLRFRRDGTRGPKSFVDADQWSVAAGGDRFVLDLVSGGPGAACVPGECAQLYGSPDEERWRPAGVGPVMELEFTSRRAGPGQAPELVVTWSLERVAR
jgi:hypothetical protein